MIHNINEVKAKAHEELHDEDFKVAVANEKHRLRMSKIKPKHKIKFQWPVKFEPLFPTHNRRATDKGRSR